MPTVLVNGIHVYYELHGEGDPLLFIAGLANTVAENERLIRAYARRFRVIAFDNRGAGRTDKPDGPYSIERMAADTAALLAALGVERAHVLGVSMGGRIATALALHYPERVISLILISTWVTRPPRTWAARLVPLMLLIPVLQTLGKRDRESYSALARQRAASRDFDATDRLGEIRVPTLILHGRKDRQAPFTCAEDTHLRIAGSRLIAFDAGHLLIFSRQQAALEAVVAFLGVQEDWPTR